jgi:hypothetical protein
MNLRSVVMRQHLISVGISCAVLAGVAQAETRTLTITNRSGAEILSISGVDKAAPDVVISFTLAGPLLHGDTEDLTVELAEGQCLLDITFTLASSAAIEQPGVDLCNIDGVVVE